MKCILCDRCKKVIEKPDQRRVVTCARPLRPRPCPEGLGRPPYRGDDPQMNDIIWGKDLCTACAAELEAFVSPASPDSGGGDSSSGGDSGGQGREPG